MDSRSKIVVPAQLPSGVRVVSGYFDPLLAVHAEWIQGLGGGAPLVVVVKEPAQPILSARARAELVAALRAVDFVVLDGPEVPPAGVRLEDRDADVAAAFVAHVRRRQQG